MDASQELADHAARFSTAVQESEVPIQVDAGLLAAFDEAPVHEDEYASLDEFLLARTTSTTTSLLHALFSLPTQRDAALGPLAVLPPPLTLLPREKPLPKAKAPTKWEAFAKAKGISHRGRDRDVWDDERQAFVPRWGRGGKNKETEEAWIREIKGGEDADHDPIATARKERKDRVAKNERQRQRNLGAAGPALSLAARLPAPAPPGVSAGKGKARAPTAAAAAGEPSQTDKKRAREVRKAELERSMAVTRGSTASLGKFDRKIEGEPKIKGVKRKFEPTAAPSFSSEKSTALSLLSTLGKPKPASMGERPRKRKGAEDGDVNVRKALRYKGREDRGRKEAGGGGGASGGKKGRK